MKNVEEKTFEEDLKELDNSLSAQLSLSGQSKTQCEVSLSAQLSFSA